MNDSMHTDLNTTETMMVEGGHHQLSGEELQQRIVEKTIRGDYYNGRRFVVFFDRNGTMEGENDLGSHGSGEWSMNMENSSFTVTWDNYWDNTTTRAYDVDGAIKLFDSTTSIWRTTFMNFEDGKKSLVVKV